MPNSVFRTPMSLVQQFRWNILVLIRYSLTHAFGFYVDAIRLYCLVVVLVVTAQFKFSVTVSPDIFLCLLADIDAILHCSQERSRWNIQNGENNNRVYCIHSSVFGVISYRCLGERRRRRPIARFRGRTPPTDGWVHLARQMEQHTLPLCIVSSFVDWANEVAIPGRPTIMMVTVTSRKKRCRLRFNGPTGYLSPSKLV